MKFFKRKRIVRRYSEPTYSRGYASIPYADISLDIDVQTTDDSTATTEDGTKAVQRLKAFCDDEILIEDVNSKQKADRIWFQGKWFECISCRLSENTPLKHYTATFVECLDQEASPE